MKVGQQCNNNNNNNIFCRGKDSQMIQPSLINDAHIDISFVALAAQALSFPPTLIHLKYII